MGGRREAHAVPWFGVRRGRGEGRRVVCGLSRGMGVGGEEERAEGGRLWALGGEEVGVCGGGGEVVGRGRSAGDHGVTQRDPAAQSGGGGGGACGEGMEGWW